jgi:hypothetical protein
VPHQLLCKLQRDVPILPMYAVTVKHRHWLRLAKFALEAREGTAASEVGMRGLSHVPTSPHEVRSGDVEDQRMILLVLSKLFGLQTPFSFW